ncbi:hypothetical protein ACFS32_00850 [Novosphingobium pokkalii]|uniref:hypothetical protein n=1 Tax=Novosphingobium pokkalii TaxID=1770194 RepID=UPI00363E063E
MIAHPSVGPSARIRLALAALAGAVLSPAAVAAQSGAPVDLTLPAAPSAPPLPAITAAVPGQLSNAAAIAPFLAQLATAPATGVLSIVQIGDSHTAGDMVSQGLRAALQARLGNAGRGMMPAGKPYQGYLSWESPRGRAPNGRAMPCSARNAMPMARCSAFRASPRPRRCPPPR